MCAVLFNSCCLLLAACSLQFALFEVDVGDHLLSGGGVVSTGVSFDIHRIGRGLRTTSRQISFEFLFIKTRPPDKLHTGFRRGIE